MRCAIDTATDHRKLLRVTFQRQSPDADSPTIDVVYHVRTPEDFSVRPVPVLVLLSATRTDSRETVELTGSEHDAIQEAATTCLAERDGEDSED